MKAGSVAAWLLVLTSACSSSSCSTSWCFVPPSSGTNEECQQSTPAAIHTELGLGDGTTCPSSESSWQTGTCPTANLYGCCVGPGDKALCYYDVTAVTSIATDCPMSTPGATWQQTVP